MPYLRLWDLVLPPPGPAAVTIGLVAALFGVADGLTARSARNTWMHRGAAFVVVAGSAGAAVHLLAVVGAIRLLPLRGVGWALAISGWIWLAARARRGWRTAREVLARPRAKGTLELCLAALTLLLAVCWAASALGPVTDADSLAYHLAAGLEWLREGHVEARPDWMHFRLVGIGEGLDALGLAAGTDSLGAAVGCIALLACAAAIAEGGEDAEARWLGACITLSVPLLAFLVPNQKPQLMPAVGVVVAGLIAVRRYGTMGPWNAVLAFGALFVAVGSKYAFLLTGAGAGCLLLASIRRSARPVSLFAIGITALVVLALPVYFRNYQLYGDPLSPLLERFRANPEPRVVAFATYLRDVGLKPTIENVLRLPLDFAVAWRPAELSTVLGIGMFAFLPALVGADALRKRLLVAALGATVLVVALGQLASRFFLEPYLWAAAALTAGPPSPVRRFFGWLVAGQAALTSVLAAYGAATLLPGAVSATAREAIMQRAALSYPEARWMDRVLPEEAVVLAQVRSVALLPRPWLGTYAIGGASDASGTAVLLEAVRTGAVSALVLSGPAADGRLEAIARDCGTPAAPPFVSRYATRNPFNRGAEYQVRAFRIDPAADRCPQTLARLSVPPSAR